MRALDRKLFRDLWHMRGQVLAIAAVIMGGVATMVMSLSTYDSLTTTRDRFYGEYRFAEAFGVLKRAPEPVAAGDAREQEVIDRVDAVLAAYGGTGACGREDQFSNRFLSEELKQLQTMATVFPAIFLGVAAFLLNIVLSRVIALQRDQIAILKGFGYSYFAIGAHYVKLVLMMAVLGVAAGLALGAWFGQGLAHVYTETTFRFPYLDYQLRPGVVLIALAVAAFAAVSGTLVSVMRAVRLPPAEGMRPEMPVAYRTSQVERFGLQRWVAAPSRMVLRHIGRHPLKSLLTVLGIACACGLMMVGNYQSGAIDFMVDVQFRQASREDLGLAFIEPTSGRALHELAALPGVDHVEGYRDVPAILRFGQYRHRAAIFGIQPEGQLHRSLDSNLQPVAVPPGGVVLTDHLANEILHVKPGGLLTVEVLEGSRPVRQVPVLGITKQFLGVSAYMQQDSLNALMREGNTVSGAYLAVQPGAEARLYADLHERPRVLGMVANKSAIQSFYATIGEFILFYNLVATLLAGAIGFGVVYNSARIALSERGRELASLRVLGFTRGEIAYILLGELALLTLAAIPVGFVVGVALVGVLVVAFQSELYRLPLLLTPENYAMGAAVVIVSALLSGLLLWHRLGRLDLVTVLKTRE